MLALFLEVCRCVDSRHPSVLRIIILNLSSAWWLQRRGWAQTIMELISPLLMMSLIVWGWSMSEEQHFPMEFPVNSTIPLASILKNEFGTANSLLQLCPLDVLLSKVNQMLNSTHCEIFVVHKNSLFECHLSIDCNNLGMFGQFPLLVGQ